jgi:uncharacterized protein YjiK
MHWFKASEPATLLEITRTGKIIGSWALPGEEQEGMIMDWKGFLYIAQDSGGILKFERKGQR